MTQLDLFGEVEAAEAAAAQAAVDDLRDGLICLRDAHPDALEIILGIRPNDRGEIKCRANGDWAYQSITAGLCFEDRTSWSRAGGWHHRPERLLTWEALDAAIADDPRLADVRAWSDSLTRGVNPPWRNLMRPHEMWPGPGGFHPSYIERDHEAEGWAERLHAWQTTLAILTSGVTGLDLNGTEADR